MIGRVWGEGVRSDDSAESCSNLVVSGPAVTWMGADGGRTAHPRRPRIRRFFSEDNSGVKTVARWWTMANDGRMSAPTSADTN